MASATAWHTMTMSPSAASASAASGGFDDISRHQIVSTAGVDREGRQVVVFFACRLPPKEDIDHERLMEYMLMTMNNIVVSDYTLVYFHHGLRSSNKPGIKWALRAYRELDRCYKKNVKKMIIMHPTAFIRGLLTAFKPVVSAKFGRKLAMMSRLSDLESLLYLDQLDIPDEVKQHDYSLSSSPNLSAARGGKLGLPSRSSPAPGGLVFGIPPAKLAERNRGDPVVPMLLQCAAHVRRCGLQTEGILRRSANSNQLQATKRSFDEGQAVDLSSLDIHTPACLLKLFFRELPEPLFTFDLYSPIANAPRLFSQGDRLDDIVTLLEKVPRDNLTLMFFVLQLLVDIANHQDKNLMSIFNISTVFGPNLLWSNKEAASLEAMERINAFLAALLENHDALQSRLGAPEQKRLSAPKRPPPPAPTSK